MLAQFSVDSKTQQRERERLFGVLCSFVLSCLYKSWPATEEERNLMVDAAIDTFRGQMGHLYRVGVDHIRQDGQRHELLNDSVLHGIEGGLLFVLDQAIGDLKELLLTGQPPTRPTSGTPPDVSPQD